MKFDAIDYLVPLVAGTSISAIHGFAEVDFGETQPKAANWYDMFGAENGESRINYATIAVQAYFTPDLLKALAVVLPYALLQTAYFEKKFKLANLQSILSGLSISKLGWEAPVAQLVQSLGLDYAVRTSNQTTYKQVVTSGKNKAAALDVAVFAVIFAILSYFKLF